MANDGNGRVMRWDESDSEGEIVVGAGGRGQGSYLLSHPSGLSLDDGGDLYVADCVNHRI